MKPGVCKTRTYNGYSCRAGFTNRIWKFYDNAIISKASITRKRCYEFVGAIGFTIFVVALRCIFPLLRSRDHTFSARSCEQNFIADDDEYRAAGLQGQGDLTLSLNKWLTGNISISYFFQNEH